jgi:hypothetical protein
MKALFKILGVAMVVAAMVFNLQISRLANSDHGTLAYVRNVAQAQTESPAGYNDKQEATGHSTVSHINTDGSECTQSFDFDKIVCNGKGAVSCTPSYTQTNVTSDPMGCTFY